MNRRWFFWGPVVSALRLGVAFGAGAGPALEGAESFLIESIDPLPTGGVRIQAGTTVGDYLVLLQGADIHSVTRPVAASLGREISVPAGQGAGFYRVMRVPRVNSLDSDQDGISDVFELQHPRILNPFNPADATRDGDDDGVTNLAEYRAGTDPESGGLTRLISSSPRAGEEGVAVTRETVLRFSRPLATGAWLSAGNFFAEAAGRRLLTRAELGTDGRSATLFYLEPLPASARVQVSLLGGALVDTLGQPLDLDADGTPGGDAQIEFYTLPTQAVPGTAVVGRVLASDRVAAGVGVVDRPLAGVTVSVDGAEESLRTTTDATGHFTLSPCPAGRFFVHIDGRTSPDSQWPLGGYYPVVGKAWEAVAGSVTNRAGGTGEIYLPHIAAGTLREISATEPTVITFSAAVLARDPGLIGVSLTVPPNSLYSENGTRGGRVGIVPVPPDRLPEALPPGLSPPLVITVQTDGPQNFDRPVPVRFPNLPDPVTHEKLPPGAKTGLWSFNHDTGRWELQGAMTVTADGQFADSDPGGGIRQPGWHAPFPGSQWEDDDDDTDPRESKEDRPCDEPPPGVDLWPLYSEITECGTTLLGVKAAQKLGTDIGQQLVGVATFAPRLLSTTNTAGVLSRALEFYQLGQGAWQISGDVVKIGVLTKLASLAPDLVTCFTGQTKEGVRLLCGLVCADDPTCQLGIGITEAEDQLANLVKPAAKFLIRTASNPKSFGTTTLNFAVAELAKALNQPGPSSSGPRGRPAADPVVPDGRLLELMSTIAEEAAINYAALTNALPAIEAAVDFLEPRGNALLAGWADMMWNSRETHWRDTAWRLAAADGQTFHGRTSRRGELTLPILRANTRYRLTFYQLAHEAHAAVEFTSAPAGQPTRFGTPAILALGASNQPDTDGDGLPDGAEETLGTDPRLADSDGDGLPDGAEVRGNSDPFSLTTVVQGPIASADTPGTALDVAVSGDLAVVADDTAGVAVFDVTPGGPPLWLAQLDTPGRAQAVAIEGTVAAVADGSFGVQVVDLARPATPRIARQILLAGGLGVAASVALADGIAYVATGARGLFVIDTADGNILATLPSLGVVDDVSVEHDLLYVLTGTDLKIYRTAALGLDLVGSVTVGGAAAPGESGRKLAVCAGFAYVGTAIGYRVIDARQPAAPSEVTAVLGAGLDVHGLAHDGTRSLAVISRFAGSPGLRTGIFDVPGLTAADNPVAAISGLGEPRALAWHRGRLLAASGSAGLTVFQPLAPDVGQIPPSFTDLRMVVDLDLVRPGIQAARNGLVRPRFAVTDDRQVARVELIIDGRIASVATQCPFLPAAPLTPATASATHATLRLRAVDAGGNVTETATEVVELVDGPTGPDLVASIPARGAVVAPPSALRLFFDAPLAGTDGFELWNLGPDGLGGTPDDTRLPLAAVELRLGRRELRLTPPGSLKPGGYAVVTPATRVTFSVTEPPNLVHLRAGPWQSPSSWIEGRVPGPGDYVVIDAPGTIYSLGVSATVAGLRCSGGISLGGVTLTIAGDVASSIGGDFSGAGSLLIVKGGCLHLSGATTLAATSLHAVDGGRILAPRLQEWICDDTLTGGELRAEGFGSELILPGLTTLRGPIVETLFDVAQRFVLRADLGGRIQAPLLGPELRGKVRLQASRSGWLSVPRVTRLTTDLLNQQISGSEIEVTTGGVLEIGPLVSVSGVRLLRGQGAELEVSQLTSVTNSGFKFGYGTAIFRQLVTANRLDLDSVGAQVILPALTRHTGPADWRVGAAGGLLAFPALVSLPGPESGERGEVQLMATANGVLELPALVDIQGRVSLVVTGDRRNTSTRLSAPNLVTVAGNPVTSGRLTRDPFSFLELPRLASVSHLDLVYQEGAPLDLPEVHRLTGGSITAETRAVPDLSQFSQLVDVSLHARQQATLNIPAATDVQLSKGAVWDTGDLGRIIFEARTSGVTRVNTSDIPALRLSPGFGGVLDLSGVPTMPRLTWTIESPAGQGVIDLSGLSTLEGPGLLRLSSGSTNGGITLLGGTVRLNPGRVVADGLRFDLRPVSSVSAGILELRQGASLTGRGEFTGSILNDVDGLGSDGSGLAPGAVQAPESRFGKITITGDYTQTARGRLAVDLMSDQNGPGFDFDQLVVQGTARLAGDLDYLAAPGVDGFYPVLQASSVQGRFEDLNRVDLAGPVARPNYDPERLALIFTLPGSAIRLREPGRTHPSEATRQIRRFPGRPAPSGR